MSWPAAFLLTQLIELAVGRFIWREVEWKRFVLIVLTASALTHPVVWFVFPSLARDGGWSYSLYLCVAESYALGIELVWYWVMRVPRPLLLAAAANGASFVIGWALQEWMLVA